MGAVPISQFLSLAGKEIRLLDVTGFTGLRVEKIEPKIGRMRRSIHWSLMSALSTKETRWVTRTMERYSKVI